jgi:hypothetical protein
MILTLEQKFDVELPTGWYELPPAHVLALGHWIYEWVEEIATPERKENLIRALGETADFVLANLSENRSWVAIMDPIDSGRVRAVASVATLAPGEAADSITNPELPIVGAVSWFSERYEQTIANFPAIVIHDIAVYPSLSGDSDVAERYVGTVYPSLSGDSDVAERYVGTVYPNSDGSVVQLEILAEDIGVFDDIIVLGNSVLDGLRTADQD